MTAGPATKVFCGFDLGGTKLAGILVERGATTVLAEDRCPSPKGTTAIVDAVAESVTKMSATAAANVGGPIEVVSVGMGAPGLVDREGVLRYAPNLPGVVDAPFGHLIAERLGIPTTIDNDATCAAWAEHERGAASGVGHSITLTLGTGIGAGMTADGRLMRGAHGFAGEPGHMVVDPTGPLCTCGRRGCWEQFASGTGLGRMAREAAEEGRAARLVELAGGDASLVRGEILATAAAEGDQASLEVLDRFAGWVALGVANLVNVLDSEVVVIGGGLAGMGDLLLDPVRRSYGEIVMGAGHRDPVRIVAATLGPAAGAWGAALLAMDRFES